MPRYFSPCTPEFLAQKILDAWKKNDDRDFDDTFSAMDEPGQNLTIVQKAESLSQLSKNLSSKIRSDLNKVDFDTENCETCPDSPYDGYNALLGIKTLPNGMTYLGCSAGGDWEYPIFYIIYWNGVSLRGYIPKLGNPYNYTTKKAFGNAEDDWKHPEHENEDTVFLKKALGVNFEPSGTKYVNDCRDQNVDKLENPTWIINDLMERIKVK